MKRYCALLILLTLASCSKSSKVITASYTLFDSSTIAINKTVSLQINTGNNILFNDTLWGYTAGDYFNGLNYIYLYAANNDSIFIEYPDTANKALSIIYKGYKN